MVASQWYEIFSLTVPSTWIAFILAVIITVILVRWRFGKEASNLLGDIAFVFLFSWKFSVLVTDASEVIAHPLMLLYYTGERLGVYIGLVSIIFYIMYRQIRGKPILSQAIANVSFISFFSSFTVLVLLFNRASIYEIFLTSTVIAFNIWLLVRFSQTISWIFPLLIVYGALHLLLEESVFSTSMITASVLGLFLVWQSRTVNMEIGKNMFRLSVLALLLSAILWTIDDTVKSQIQLDELDQEQGDLVQASNFTLTTLSDEKISLKEFRGKKVVLNFWATWCPPCKAEMPHMQNYYESFAEEQNVAILAINLTSQDDGIKKIQQFVSDYELSFPILLDQNNEVAQEYNVITIPTTYIIDEQGKVKNKITGPISKQMLKSLLGE